MWVSALLPLHPNTLANFFPFSLFLFLDKVPLVLLLLLLWRPSFQLGATLNRYLFRVRESENFWPVLLLLASTCFCCLCWILFQERAVTNSEKRRKEGKQRSSLFLHFHFPLSSFVFNLPSASFLFLFLFSCTRPNVSAQQLVVVVDGDTASKPKFVKTCCWCCCCCCCYLPKEMEHLPASTSAAAAEQRKGNPVLNHTHTQTHTAAFSVVVQKPLFLFSFRTFFLAKICRSSTTATLLFTSCTKSPASYTFAFFFFVFFISFFFLYLH